MSHRVSFSSSIYYGVAIFLLICPRFFVGLVCFLGCNWDIEMVRWCFSSFNFFLNFRNERYLQSQWPLAAKYGTRFANSLQGSDFAYVSYNGGGWHYSCFSC